MSLVGDYGDSDEDIPSADNAISSISPSSTSNTNTKNEYNKRLSSEPLAPLEKRSKTSHSEQYDEDDELPPLPATFNESKVPRIHITRSPPLPHKEKKIDEENVEMEDKKRSFLIPPQLRKKTANISTEDTSSWTTERGKKKKSLNM